MQKHDEKPEEALRLPNTDAVANRRKETGPCNDSWQLGAGLLVTAMADLALGEVEDLIKLKGIGIGDAEVAAGTRQKGPQQDNRPH